MNQDNQNISSLLRACESMLTKTMDGIKETISDGDIADLTTIIGMIKHLQDYIKQSDADNKPEMECTKIVVAGYNFDMASLRKTLSDNKNIIQPVICFKNEETGCFEFVPFLSFLQSHTENPACIAAGQWVKKVVENINELD